MPEITVRNYTSSDAAAIYDLQMRYAEVYPGAAVVPGEVYNHPSFEGGRNIYCALDPQGRLLGYAPVFPQPVLDPQSASPHVIWAEVKADPATENPVAVKDMLWERVLGRAHEIAEALPPRRLELRFEYLPSEAASLEYVRARGAVHYESVFKMGRDLGAPIVELPLPAGIAAAAWKMRTGAERERYLLARNQAFAEAPKDRDGLGYLLDSPLWAEGTSYTAFAGEEVVGSVLVYWDTEDNRRRGQRIGFTEDIFVLSAWRKRGIASYLITQGLFYLREHGLAEAHLQVRVHNQAALGIYERLGYCAGQQTLLLQLAIRN